MFDDDRDGFDEWVPEELRPWFESRMRRLSGGHFILVDGKIKEVSLMEWARWFEDFENRRVDRTDISNEPNYPGGDYISTVFLGLDHNFSGGERPILFETMVFGGEYSQRGWRYASYGEAKQGHWQIVDCIKNGEPPYVHFGERPAIEYFFEMLEELRDEEDEEI